MSAVVAVRGPVTKRPTLRAARARFEGLDHGRFVLRRLVSGVSKPGLGDVDRAVKNQSLVSGGRTSNPAEVGKGQKSTVV